MIAKNEARKAARDMQNIQEKEPEKDPQHIESEANPDFRITSLALMKGVFVRVALEAVRRNLWRNKNNMKALVL